MPGVDELELVESTAALRPGSPDNAPLIGATSLPQLYVGCGHYRNGILLAPVTADLLCAAITGSETEADRELLGAVSPARFAPADMDRAGRNDGFASMRPPVGMQR
jgi:glycine oxidase